MQNKQSVNGDRDSNQTISLRDNSLICCMNNATKALEESVKAYTQRLCGIENH